MHQTMRAAPCAWLVFLLLAPNLLSATADKCKSSDVNLSEGEEKKVDTSYGGYVTWQSLFLHLKEGFKGMDLKISGGSGEVIMSFDAEIECFRQGTHWYKMHFTCGYTVDSEYVWCAIVGGDCRWHCSKKYTSNGSIKLIVIAKGPSEWKLDTPNLDTCPRRDVTWLTRNRNHSMGIVACNLKDAAMPGDDSTMVLAVVLPVVVLVVLVAVIVMVMKKSNSCQERIPFLMPTRHTPRMRPLPAASPPWHAPAAAPSKPTHIAGPRKAAPFVAPRKREATPTTSLSEESNASSPCSGSEHTYQDMSDLSNYYLSVKPVPCQKPDVVEQ